VPQAHGGLGLGAVELALLSEELGRAVAPGPLLPTLALLVPALVEAGTPEQQARWLPAVAEGRLTGSLAAGDPARPGGPVAATTADGWRLEGRTGPVVEGATVDEVVVAAPLEGTGELGLFVVPVAKAKPEPIDALDASRGYATLHLDGLVVGPERRLAGGAAALARVEQVAQTALALEVVGACQALFDLTLAHAKVREQFGVPIGSFQAVKHALADAHVALEKARALGYFAAMTIAEDDGRRALAAAMAKAAAGDCERRLVRDAIQLHGGIGYTWEHDVHLYAKRAMAGAMLFGTATVHRQRVADLIGLTP
jgi:alkylation response protein AidB-like acyl-CoA dehydrogenase